MPESDWATQCAFINFRKQVARKLHASVNKVQSLVAMDDAMARLEQLAPETFILHGSAALFARGIPGSRVPRDLDIYVAGVSDPEQANRLFASAFDAVVQDASPIQSTVMKSIQTEVGGKFQLASTHRDNTILFSVDLRPAPSHVVGYEVASPMVDARAIGIEPKPYSLLAMNQQLAEKVCGILVPHVSVQGHGLSTRYKDVVDLLAIAKGQPIDVSTLSTELLGEIATYGEGVMPTTFVPNSANPGVESHVREQWVRGVEKALGSSAFSGLSCRDAEEALSPFLEPLLDGSARGIWNPRAQEWSTTIDLTDATLASAHSQQLSNEFSYER